MHLFVFHLEKLYITVSLKVSFTVFSLILGWSIVLLVNRVGFDERNALVLLFHTVSVSGGGGRGRTT